jgi:hypothetical protein
MLGHESEVRVRMVEQLPRQVLRLLALDHESQRALSVAGLVQGHADGISLQAYRLPEHGAELFEEP